jgi:Raf kinase inhibitor-like YbhB/YbcL family protein
MTFALHSTAFQQGQAIPARHTEDGEDVSPQLSWDQPPASTRQLAVICDDPDAPSPEPWVHWVIYGIPANMPTLPEGVPASDRFDSPVTALQGKTSWTSGQTVGYRGPAPPRGHGVHHYHFKLYALDRELDLQPGLTKAELLQAIEPHVIATTELVGTYAR